MASDEGVCCWAMSGAKLSREEVLKIASLARLELSEDEVGLYQEQIGRVLGYIAELNQLKTPADAFVRHVPKDAVSFREDMPIPFGDTPALMRNAPETESDHFLLPPVVERS